MKVLSEPVLVLNKVWIRIRVESVQKALVHIYDNKALVIDTETYVTYSWKDWVKVEVNNGDKFIRVCSGKIKAPKVIVLKDYDKMPAFKVKLTRKNLLLRDDYRDQYTGEILTPKDATIDHVWPRSRGGKTEWTNVVICSKKTNTKKGNRTPKEAGLKLLRQPYEPVWSYFFLAHIHDKPPEWENFIPSKKR